MLIILIVVITIIIVIIINNYYKSSLIYCDTILLVSRGFTASRKTKLHWEAF